MRIALINAVDYGSTGQIMLDIAQTANDGNNLAYAFSGGRKRERKNIPYDIRFSSPIDFYFHSCIGYLFGVDGYCSFFSTKKLIRLLERFNPDLIHLHIVHGTFINFDLLFHYINKKGLPVVWTFHDCWAFTGRCPHFQITNCEKWKYGCNKCTYPKRLYPSSFAFDRTKLMWKRKKQLFSSISNLTIVTPSLWLKELVSQSFFSKKTIRVINNGIDLSFFKPQKNNLREENNWSGKRIILGVSNIWSYSKGLDVFIKLSEQLNDNYLVIIVGHMPNSIILPKAMHHIDYADKEELVILYSEADVFINPTREDTFPTVNIESLACGTPVITFNTGGSPEIIDKNSGVVVEVDDYEYLKKEIERVCIEKPFSAEKCRERSLLFDKKRKFQEYVNLYSDLLK